MQEIVQDADSVGTALKTISMRIRGYDEETEELSEDYEDLSGVIADLTKSAKHPHGISLFTDETKSTYKSTYEVLKDISEIYDELSDKQQSELIEKLFGKARANTGVAILKNFDQAKSALNQMADSAGNADKEMGVIEQGIDYKINALKQTWVGLGQDLIDRGVVGDIVDALTEISKVLTEIISKAGVLRTLLMGAFGFMGAKDALHVNSNGGILSSFMTGLVGTNGGSIIGDILGRKANNDFNALVKKSLDNGWTIDIDSDGFKNVNGAFKEAYKDLIEGMKNPSADKDALFAGYIAQTEKASQATSKFATIARSAGAMLTNMIAGFIVSEILNFGKAILTASKDMKKLQENAKTALEESKKTIDSYRESIQAQANILNDETASHEQVISAKEKLASLQDEIIDKYGKYEESGQVIQGITDLINGQTDAVDNLSNSLNNLSNYDYSNIKKSLDSGENLGHMERLVNWLSNKFRSFGSDEKITNSKILFNNMSNGFSAISQLTTEDFMSKVFGTNSEFYKKYGTFEGKTLSDFFNIIENNRDKFNDIFDSDEYADLKDYYNLNKDFYDQYVLNEKILKDYKNQYEKFNEINEDYSSADNDLDKKISLMNYRDLVDSLKNEDNYVIDYFRTRNSELDDAFSELRLEERIKADSRDIEKLGKDIDSAYNGIGENIKFFNEKTADNAQQDVWARAKAMADEYGISIDALINKMLEFEKITAYGSNENAYRNLDTIIKQDGIKLTDDVDKLLEKKDTKEITGELKDLIKEYNGTKLYDKDTVSSFAKEVTDGMKFGNIDFAKREPLLWTKENIKKYEDALKDMAPDILEDNGLNKIVSSALGGFDSKLLHNVENRGQKKENLEMYYTFTPFIEDENGKIIDMLNSSQVNNYIDTLFNKAQKDGKITAKEILELDIEGIETKGVEGGKISNLLAYVGYSEKKADLTSRLMHYSGKSGASAVALSNEDMINWNLKNITEESKAMEKAETARLEAIDKAESDYRSTLSKSTNDVTKNKKAHEDRTNAIKDANDAYKKTIQQSKQNIFNNQKSALETYNWMLKEVGDGTDYASKKSRESIYAMMNSMIDFSQQAMDLGHVKINIEAETTNINAVTTALSEMNAVGGLTEDTMNGLTSAFSGMNSWDKSALFEKTAEGISLNRKELERLSETYANDNIDEVKGKLESLVEQYNLLADQIRDCNVADTEQLSSLIQKSNGIREQITELDQLRSQYEGLTSSYAKWQRALSTTNNNDMFKNEADQYENMKQILDDGWWGNDDLNAYLELMLGDWRAKGYDNQKEAFDSLTTKKIINDHSLMDYFTYRKDENGNKQSDMTVAGLDLFIQDMVAMAKNGTLDSSLYNADTGDFNFGKIEFKNGEWVTGLDKLAEAFGTTTEQMEIFFKALQEKGEDVHFGSIVDDVIADADNTIAEQRKALEESLKELGTTEEEIIKGFGLKVKASTKEMNGALKDYEEKIKELKEIAEKEGATEEDQMNLAVVQEGYRNNLYRQYEDSIANSVLMNMNLTEQMKNNGADGASSYIGGFKSFVEGSNEMLINFKVGTEADQEQIKSEAKNILTVVDDLLANYDDYSVTELSGELGRVMRSEYKGVGLEFDNMESELKSLKGIMEEAKDTGVISDEDVKRLETFSKVARNMAELPSFKEFMMSEFKLDESQYNELMGIDASVELQKENMDATKDNTTATNDLTEATNALIKTMGGETASEKEQREITEYSERVSENLKKRREQNSALSSFDDYEKRVIERNKDGKEVDNNEYNEIKNLIKHGDTNDLKNALERIESASRKIDEQTYNDSRVERGKKWTEARTETIREERQRSEWKDNTKQTKETVDSLHIDEDTRLETDKPVDNVDVPVKNATISTSNLDFLPSIDSKESFVQEVNKLLQMGDYGIENGIKIPIDVSSMNMENVRYYIDDINQQLQGLGSDLRLYIDADNSLALSKIGEVIDEAEMANPTETVRVDMKFTRQDGDSLVDGDATVDVNANTEPLDTDAKASVSAVDSMVGTAKIDGDPSLFDAVVESVRAKLASLKSEIQNVANQASSITVPNTGGGGNTGGTGSTKHFYTGTFGFYGGTMSAFAEGSHDVTVGRNQTALVNELGEEALVRDGQLSIIHGGAQFIKLKSSDIIFNHRQTEELKKRGMVTSSGGRGKQIGAHANGTFGNHPIGAFWTSSINNAGSGGHASVDSISIAGTDVPKTLQQTANSASQASQSASNAAQSASKASESASNASDKNEEVIDWIETKISRIERIIENLSRKAESTFNIWSDRAKALTDQIAKIREEITIQGQASDRYLKEANSVGLAEDYAKKVRDGLIDIEKITDDTLKENINKYKEYYEKYLESLDKQDELNETLKELYQTAFENVSSEYEEIIGDLQAQNDLIDAQITLVETRGHLVEESSYASMIETENKILKEQEKELKELEKAFSTAIDTGKIAKNSEAWYSMKATIDEVRKALVETNNQIVEYQNNIRQLKWDAFDKLRDAIADINDEAEFMEDLLDAYNLVNEQGNLTDNGFATMGLYATSYKTLMEQANAYKEEMLKISEDLAKDPNNQTLLDRRQELIKSQRDAIKGAESEKESIKDLISDGYDKQLDYLQKLIDKYKKVINEEKD